MQFELKRWVGRVGCLEQAWSSDQLLRLWQQLHAHPVPFLLQQAPPKTNRFEPDAVTRPWHPHRNSSARKHASPRNRV
jgi:hypothetical protein